MFVLGVVVKTSVGIVVMLMNTFVYCVAKNTNMNPRPCYSLRQKNGVSLLDE